MGEDWALEAIRSGSISLDGEEFIIMKQTTGGCEGCYYEGQINKCHPKAVTICCTGGNILLKDE